MTCERCPHEASIHLTETVDGRRREVHLCADCARKAGLAPTADAPSLPLGAVLESLILAKVGELVGDLAQRSCPACGLKYMEYRGEGRFGCPHDYRTFEAGLVPWLRRAQGATRHVGKLPRRSGGSDADRRLMLRARLRQAVAREDYEEAARLRDQLRPKDADR